MLRRGSLSLEAALSMSMVLLLVLLSFQLIYGYLLQQRFYDESVCYLLRHNDEKRVEEDLEQYLGEKLLRVGKGFVLKTLPGVEETLAESASGWSEPIQEITFITDTGAMMHKPGCPTVSLSLRPVLYRDAVKKYGRCSICYPGK